MIDDKELWACALLLMDEHGDDAPRIIAERIDGLIIADDWAGIEVWKEIARRVETVLTNSTSSQ